MAKPNMPTDLSIIIVSWNARDFLVRAVDSVLATVLRHTCEIIVVDNASRDGSPETIAELFPQVRLIRNDANLGFARANNIGIAQARGRMIGLVNSDAEALPECLDRLVDIMDAHPRWGIVGPRVLNLDGTVQHSHWNFPSIGRALARALALDTLVRIGTHSSNPADPADPSDSKTPDPVATVPVNVLSGCFMILRREALEAVGFLDEDFYIYGEDMDLCRRFHAAGWEVRLDPGARATHAGGASSANAPVRFFLELQRANLCYWSKHHGRAGAAFFLAVTFIHHLLRLVSGIIIYLTVPPLRNTFSYKIKRSTACMKWILHHPRSGTA